MTIDAVPDEAKLSDKELKDLRDWIDADCRGKAIDPPRAADAATKKAWHIREEEARVAVADINKLQELVHETTFQLIEAQGDVARLQEQLDAKNILLRESEDARDLASVAADTLWIRADVAWQQVGALVEASEEVGENPTFNAFHKLASVLATLKEARDDSR